MYKFHFFIFFLLLLSCAKTKKVEKIKIFKSPKIINKTSKEIKQILLNKKNTIPFLKEYGEKNIENKVRISTKYGDIEIELFKKTPYHRANFIYLTKKKYFNNTFFHRVVKGFIIQGGNSDNISTSKKRASLGRYLLPPDTKKGYNHLRGTVSMPSSEIDNPHKLASPYEFFIVSNKDGAPHLDGNYTPFGKVVKGLDVVDLISNQPVDNRETPIQNIKMIVSIIK